MWTATFSTWRLHSTLSGKTSRRAALDLLKGEEGFARDKVDAPKPKKRLLDINESDDDSDGESKVDELTSF